MFIVVFDERAHDGSNHDGSNVVGPFDSREGANNWASLDTAGGTASWEVWEVETPS